jgi:hypothetical protein
MEAYCNVVRALDDKFYSIELNHIPHKYNEEAMSSRRLRRGESPFPRTFSHATLLNLLSTLARSPRSNPRGLPRVQQAQNPWTRTPQMRHSYSSYSRGTG